MTATPPAKSENQVATNAGTYTQDASGVWHYRCRKEVILTDGIRDALSVRPKGPAWFWWNTATSPVPCPIEAGEGPESLRQRWSEIHASMVCPDVNPMKQMLSAITAG